MSNSTIQYEIKAPGKAVIYTNVEESALKHMMAQPDTQLFVRGWFAEGEPPTERVEVTNLVRQAIVLGRGRG